MLTVLTINSRIFQLNVAFAEFSFTGMGGCDALAAQDWFDAAQLAGKLVGTAGKALGVVCE